MYTSVYRNHFFSLALVSGLATCVFLWMGLRRTGFNTSYSRVWHLITQGEFKMVLEPGAFPENVFLPPHLRLDRLSYLDLPETELAVPPLTNLNLSERETIIALEGQLPAQSRADVHFGFGPFRSHSVIMSSVSSDRYIRRRLGISKADRELMAEGDRAADAERERC